MKKNQNRIYNILINTSITISMVISVIAFIYMLFFSSSVEDNYNVEEKIMLIVALANISFPLITIAYSLISSIYQSIVKLMKKLKICK